MRQPRLDGSTSARKLGPDEKSLTSAYSVNNSILRESLTASSSSMTKMVRSGAITSSDRTSSQAWRAHHRTQSDDPGKCQVREQPSIQNHDQRNHVCSRPTPAAHTQLDQIGNREEARHLPCRK